VLQRRQDVALALKAARQVCAHAGPHRQLQGDFALEGPIGTLRQPHLGHAAGSQRPDQPIRADGLIRLQTASDLRLVAGGSDLGQRAQSIGPGDLTFVRQQRRPRLN
jgi:hypothetical protein